MAVVWNHYAWLPAKGDEKKNLAHLVARHIEVQAELSRVAAEIATNARARLAAHREQGHAEILTERKRIDHYVILSDERGLNAALSIEYGRQGDTSDINPDTGKPRGHMDALYILTDAVIGLPRKGKR